MSWLDKGNNVVVCLKHVITRYEFIIADNKKWKTVRSWPSDPLNSWHSPGVNSRQTHQPMLDWCWATVYDDGPISSQHWNSVTYLLGYHPLYTVSSTDTVYMRISKVSFNMFSLNKWTEHYANLVCLHIQAKLVVGVICQHSQYVLLIWNWICERKI